MNTHPSCGSEVSNISTEESEGPPTAAEMVIHVNFPVQEDAAIPSGFATIIVHNSVTVNELLTYLAEDHTDVPETGMYISFNDCTLGPNARLTDVGVESHSALDVSRLLDF